MLLARRLYDPSQRHDESMTPMDVALEQRREPSIWRLRDASRASDARTPHRDALTLANARIPKRNTNGVNCSIVERTTQALPKGRGNAQDPPTSKRNTDGCA